MNKTAVKNYAVEARKKWIQAIAQQAAFYGCTENGCLGDAKSQSSCRQRAFF
jgi:HJR/Mrr/RecB family endonuclease